MKTITPPNNPPIAYAGPDQLVDGGTSLTLNGASSFDPNDDILSYTWTQISVFPVTLSNPNQAEPYFTAPKVMLEEQLVFQLIVDDGLGDSTPEIVTINVRPSYFTLSSTAEGDTYTVKGKSDHIIPLSFNINPKESVKFGLPGREGVSWS